MFCVTLPPYTSPLFDMNLISFFSEGNSINASHDKSEVENKTSNNSIKNELNEKLESSKHNGLDDGSFKEAISLTY